MHLIGQKAKERKKDSQTMLKQEELFFMAGYLLLVDDADSS